MKAIFNYYMGIAEKRLYIDCFSCRFWCSSENECLFKIISAKDFKLKSCRYFKFSLRSIGEILVEMGVRQRGEFSIGGK